jgi:electron transport complex protein RnfD
MPINENGSHASEAIPQLDDASAQYYKHICWMAVPLLCFSAYLYGARPVLLCGAALLTGNLCDRLVALLRGRRYEARDYSNESFALVLALLMPATVSWYVLIAAVVAGVLVGKEAFGGYGSYPFHPAAVGYAVAAVSWPEQVFRYPQPYTQLPLGDASGVPVSTGISSTLSNGGVPNISTMSLLLGEFAAPMGTGAALILVACGLFLLVHRDIHISAPLSFLLACALIAFFFPRQADLVNVAVAESVDARLNVVKYELLSGAAIFNAVFLINEPFTCPRTRMGRVVYGALVGAVTMGVRYYGAYETGGVCFALLLINSVSGWLDRVVRRVYRILHPAQHERQERGRPQHEKLPSEKEKDDEKGGAGE